jgi:hypothetical protein
MKVTLPLATALFLGSAALAAVHALPVYSSDAASSVVQVAAKSAKTAKTAKVTKTGKAGCKGTHMYWSAKDKKCMDARQKKST